MKISHIINLIVIALVFIGCSKEKNYSVEIKDGVEIIKNKNVESAPNLQLDLKLISDISLDNLVLPDSIPAMESFYMTALDEEGNIYISNFKNCVIYKIDKDGHYISNFHRKGQGPGESDITHDVKVIGDSVFVFGDYGKTSIYTRSGKFIRQKRILEGKFSAMQIINTGENIFSFSRNIVADYEEKVSRIALGVYLLDSSDIEKHKQILEINAIADLNNYRYLMNDDQRQFAFFNDLTFVEDLSFTNYTVDVYDLTGAKIRRIEKQTRRIACPDEIKNKAKAMDERNSMIKVVADYMKQILRMYVDKNGNLWVCPAVEGLGFRHNYFDIFNSEGVFMKRIKLPLPEGFMWLAFDKGKLIVRDNKNCIVKVFDYEFI